MVWDQYFEGRSCSLKTVKIALLFMLLANVIFSITILVLMNTKKKLILPYLGVQVNMTNSACGKDLIDAIFKTGMEEMSQFIILEFMGFFAVLFEGVTLTLMFATAYLMPSTRIAINLIFGKASPQWFFIFLVVLKLLSSLISFMYACLVAREYAPNAQKKAPESSSSSIGSSISG